MISKIAVLLADDHVVVRQAICYALKGEPDIKVVGEAGNGREAVQLAKKLFPDVVVMDIGMPLLNGLEATRRIVRGFPNTRVLVLSQYSDDEYVRQAVAAGALGYITKQCCIDDLVWAIREVNHGDVAFCPNIGRRLGKFFKKAMSLGKSSGKPELTSCQLEVLQLIAEGYSTKQIAKRLKRSTKTVEFHRSKLMERLGLYSPADLTRYAVSKGIIEIPKPLH